MTKIEFINQLRLHLHGLPPAEIEDIVRDQEEFIREAISAGRTEEQVLKSLGSPVDLAKSLKAEIKVVQAQGQKDFSAQVKGFFGAVAAVLVLAPFNLIFVLGPMTALFGILFGGWVAVIALSSVFTILSFGAAVLLVFSPAGFVFHLAGVFGMLALTFAGMTGVGLMYFLTRAAMKLVLSYLSWNIQFIKKQTA